MSDETRREGYYAHIADAMSAEEESDRQHEAGILFASQDERAARSWFARELRAGGERREVALRLLHPGR